MVWRNRTCSPGLAQPRDRQGRRQPQRFREVSLQPRIWANSTGPAEPAEPAESSGMQEPPPAIRTDVVPPTFGGQPWQPSLLGRVHSTNKSYRPPPPPSSTSASSHHVVYPPPSSLSIIIAITMRVWPTLLFWALAGAQGPPDGIAPLEPSPEGCEDTVQGNFTLGILFKGGARRTARSSASGIVVVRILIDSSRPPKPTTFPQASDNAAQCSLKHGVLHDAHGWTGSIVANYQFQFDGPPQAGAIYTGGWSVCQNASLAIGPNTTFYHCMSGGFANLYSVHIGAQCQPVDIVVSFLDNPSASSSSGASSSTGPSSTVELASSSATNHPPITTASDGTPIATSLTTPVTSIPAAPNAEAVAPTGGAVPPRVPRRETFGAVIGILGAALML